MITYAKYKIMRSLSDDSQQTKIETFIEMVNDEIKQYCNTDFLNDEDVDISPVSIDLIGADLVDFYMYQENKVSSQSLEGNSISFNNSNKQEIYSKLDKFRKKIL